MLGRSVVICLPLRTTETLGGYGMVDAYLLGRSPV